MPSRSLPDLAVPAARSFIAIGAVIYLFDLFQQTRDHLTNGAGRPLGDDFINFWSGAYLALHGRVSEIYSPTAFHAFQQSVVGAPLDGYLYSYPPVLLLLTAPFALIPYVPALVLWLSAGWFAFYRALRLAVPGRRVLLLALAAPAVLISAVGGQNGTWTAALFGGGLGLLNRRPAIAGALLGLLIFKPQLAVLIPLALLGGRHWRALAAAALTATALMVLSALCFGTEPWLDYLRNVEVFRQFILGDGTGIWHRSISIFVAARRLGMSIETAYLIQGIAAAVACIAVLLVWFGNASSGVKNATLLLGTCFVSPYLQDYDLVLVVLAVAWLWQEPAASPKSDRMLNVAAALCLVLPLCASSLAHLTGLALGPLFIIPLFVLALRQSLQGGANYRMAPAPH